MSRYFYSLLITLLAPLLVLRLFVKGLREPDYARQWWRRFALFLPKRSRAGDGLIWVHAVSVGESIAAAPMVRELLKRYPALPITVTALGTSHADVTCRGC